MRVGAVSGCLWIGVGSLVLLAAGCGSADDAEIAILGNVRPDGSCSYSTAPDAPLYNVGYIDVAFGRPYRAHLLVQNGGSDPVTIQGGWRSVWYEPPHVQLVGGRGARARDGLVAAPVLLDPGQLAIVEVDPLGAGYVSFRHDFEETIAAGGAPLDLDSSILLSLEGDADGTTIASEPWTYGITIGLGRLSDASPGSDSAAVPGVDCCLTVASIDACETGQNDHRGSCSECAGCWPEVCNFGQNPACGGDPLPGCGAP